jgi:hypothetical protein
MLAALINGGLFLAHPATITNELNQATTKMARSILTKITMVDPKDGPDDKMVTRDSFSGDLADSELQISTDRFMRIFVYKPWLAMEFGDAEKNKK